MDPKPPNETADVRLTILIVEDSDMLRQMLRMAITSAHLVYGSSTIKEGMGLYKEKLPDMIFLDIGLPDGSGHDLARDIKSLNPAAYVVMVTASHHIDDKVGAAHNHVDGFIVKPFTKKDVSDHIDRYLTFRRKVLTAIPSI